MTAYPQGTSAGEVGPESRVAARLLGRQAQGGNGRLNENAQKAGEQPGAGNPAQ